MTIRPRTGNALGALACAGLMAYALYVQHVLGYEPCPLCIFQRVAVTAVGIFFALAALQGPGPAGRRAYAVLMLLAAGGGIGVASRHLWLQSLPPDKVPSCGPGLDFLLDTLPLRDVLSTVLSGSGECAQVNWVLLGISMPGWVLAALVVLGGFGLWNNLWNNLRRATA
jgi:disulfide bond formation protein DsbB